MKVIFLVQFNREKCNVSYKSQIYKIKKNCDLNFCKYPSRSIYNILNYKPVYTEMS